MTTQEIHIDLDYHIQKINSNATRNVEAKEKDWLFNAEVYKFLSSRTRIVSDLKGVGFQGDTKRLVDIKPLIKKKRLTVEKIDDKVGKVVLPTFSYKPIRVDCVFFKECKESEYKEENRTSVLKYFKFPNAKDSYRINITIGNVTKTIFNTALLPSNYIKGNYFYLLKAFIIQVRNLFENDKFFSDNLEFYYEWYGDTFKADTFFFKGKADFVNIDIRTTSFESIATVGNVMGAVNLVTTENLPYTTYSSKIDITNTARLANEEVEINKLNSNLSGSLQESPLVSIEKNICYVYNPKYTIIKSIDFVYIENPQQIDLSLGQSLNLDRPIIQEIVISTARFVKALFDNNNYEKYLQESTLIE